MNNPGLLTDNQGLLTKGVHLSRHLSHNTLAISPTPDTRIDYLTCTEVTGEMDMISLIVNPN
jgi:hypothetical protein